MLRFTLLVIGFYLVCCAIAYGQNNTNNPNQGQNPPGPRSMAAGSTRERPVIPLALPTDNDTPQGAIRRSGGSLLRAAATPPVQEQNPTRDYGRAALRAYSPFAVSDPEPKLVRKRDLITIVIREESETSNIGTSDLKRESAVDASINQFMKLNIAHMRIDPSIGTAVPQISMTGNRSFKGEATVDRTDSFIARIQAEVVDVKPNGTLVLQARKKIKNDDEEQVYICSGVARVEDITPDNTVLSTQLFDLEVSKTTKGQVRSTTQKGVIGKLLDFINPF